MQLVEELFNETIRHPPQARTQVISVSCYTEEVKETVSRLVLAFEGSSSLLNDDLLSDLERVSPQQLESLLNQTSDWAGTETEADEESEDANDIAYRRGQRIDKYQIEEVLGTGGMSVVYRARQFEPVERKVAVKLMRPSHINKVSLKRFYRELQAAALLRHPNIATLYEVTQTEKKEPVAVMELVDGDDITTFCNRHSLGWKKRVGVFLKVCKGLAHAHREGIVHRDIKPSNILVAVQERRPVPKLIDFGIATIKRSGLKNNHTLTRMGHLIGSPRYMSPEQFDDSHSVDQRSDIHSAAMVLFELLVGVPFREGNTANELILEAGCESPLRLSQRIKNVASERGESHFSGKTSNELARFARRDLDWILAKALAKDPQERYQDIESFARDLRAAMMGESVSVTAPGRIVQSSRFLKSNARRIWMAVSLGLIAVLGFGLYYTLDASSKSNQARAVAEAQQAKEAAEAAAANDLVMKLLASDRYQLTPDQFDLNLIPAYRAHFQKIQQSGGPKTKEDKFVYGILAVMEAMAGDFDQAEILMETADAGTQLGELRSVRDKICEKYADIAKVRLGQLDSNSESFEKASQQMTLGRCYTLWGMYPDARQLLGEAINYFEDEHPGSYESLVAHLTLAKIFEKSGNFAEARTLLEEARMRFASQVELLKSERGKVAWTSMETMQQRLSKKEKESFEVEQQ